jgi:hypothetical protein
MKQLDCFLIQAVSLENASLEIHLNWTHYCLLLFEEVLVS